MSLIFKWGIVPNLEKLILLHSLHFLSLFFEHLTLMFCSEMLGSSKQNDNVFYSSRESAACLSSNAYNELEIDS